MSVAMKNPEFRKKAKFDVSVSTHAIHRLEQRFPQFRLLSYPAKNRIIELVAFLGRKLKRSCAKHHGNHLVMIRGKDLFQTGEDIVLLLTPMWPELKEKKGWKEFSVVTVITYDQYIEYRRSAREQRSLRKV